MKIFFFFLVKLTLFVEANVKNASVLFSFCGRTLPGVFWDWFSRHPTLQKHVVFLAKTYFYIPLIYITIIP